MIIRPIRQGGLAVRPLGGAGGGGGYDVDLSFTFQDDTIGQPPVGITYNSHDADSYTYEVSAPGYPGTDKMLKMAAIGGTGQVLADVDAAVDLSDQIIEFDYLRTSSSANTEFFIRSDGSAVGAQNGYRVRVTNGYIYIDVMTAGAAVSIANFYTGFTHNQVYRIVFEAVGTTIRAKTWLKSGSEPGTWTVSAVDATYAYGNAQVGSLLGIYYDNIDIKGTQFVPEVLTLPYIINFEADTIGQSPAGFTQDPLNTIDSVVVACPLDFYNQNTQGATKALYFEAPASGLEATKTNLVLPGTIDVREGLRWQSWCKGIKEEQQYAGYVALTNKRFANQDPADNMISMYEQLLSGKSMYCNGADAGVYASINMGGHSSLHSYHWHSIRSEYDPGSNTISSWVFQTNTGSLRHAAVLVPTWTQVTWQPFQHFGFHGSAKGNVYQDDTWVTAVWIGGLTDAWPSVTTIPTNP